MDSCPTCKREIEHFNEYSLVKILGIKKVNMPTTVKFLYKDYKTFVSVLFDERPSSISRPKSRKGPNEVLDFFKENPRRKNFEHGEWNWYRTEKDGKEVYICSNKQLKTIMRQLNPYLSTLETLVGKEVLPSKLYISDWNRCVLASKIPGTKYFLQFRKTDKKFKNCEELELTIARFRSNTRWTARYELASIGTLKYKGLIKK